MQEVIFQLFVNYLPSYLLITSRVSTFVSNRITNSIMNNSHKRTIHLKTISYVESSNDNSVTFEEYLYELKKIGEKISSNKTSSRTFLKKIGLVEKGKLKYDFK